MKTDVLELGSIIEDRIALRDAVHIAVAPVVAAEDLHPGQHIGFVDNNNNMVGSKAESLFGIVDPFLKITIKRGSQFWAFLYPGTIRSLRHEWRHKDFVSEEERKSSEAWIREWANSLRLDYVDVITHANSYICSGYYWNAGGTFEGYSVPDEFWDHFEVITGITVSKDDRGSFFSCSC